ncbi:TatD family hydrolase [Archaeoglobus sp.]
MECFDTHMHSEGKGITELRAMAKRGIKRVVSCSYYPIPPSSPETLIDEFRKLETFEVERGKRAGMSIYPAIGVHPRCIPPNYEKALRYVEENAKIIGEIGLETANDLEVEVLKAQLEIAKVRDVPCVIHTPKKNKLEVTEKILKLLEDLSFPEDLAVIDHATEKTVPVIMDKGYWIGLTVQKGKITSEEVARIVERHGFERFLLNSDTGFNDEEMFTTAETVEFLLEKFDKVDVEKIAFKNAEKVFRV